MSDGGAMQKFLANEHIRVVDLQLLVRDLCPGGELREEARGSLTEILKDARRGRLDSQDVAQVILAAQPFTAGNGDAARAMTAWIAVHG